jgi:thiol-disulfide isomerase/thioredoxin
MRWIFVLFLFRVTELYSQNSGENILIYIRNYSSNYKIDYYDSSLNIIPNKFENISVDTIKFTQFYYSSIGGFGSLSNRNSQFGLITMPNDTISIIISSKGIPKITLLNQGMFYTLRNKEQQLIGVIDEHYITKINTLLKRKRFSEAIDVYKIGFDQRKVKLKEIFYEAKYKSYLDFKLSFLELQKRNLILNINITNNLLTKDEIFKYFYDSIVKFSTDVKIQELPNTYNIIGASMQKITKRFPDEINYFFWFKFIKDNIVSQNLGKKLILYYIKRSEYINIYDSLSMIASEHYGGDDFKRILKKYRNLKFLNKSNLNSSSLIDSNNTIINLDTILSQNRGKYSYIDFWASWCAPCIAEMPISKTLAERYNNKISFIYLSIDNDTEPWLMSIKRLKLDGSKNFLLSDGVFIINGMKYPVKSIPRYMLIDPGGNLIDDNAPRPSSKEIKDIFNKIK